MSIPDNKKRVCIVIEKDTEKKIKAIAKEQERSLNYIVNKAILEYIEKQNKS